MTKFWDTSLQSPSGWPPKACEACFRSAWASKAMPRRWQKPATTPGLFWTLFSSLYIWVYPISVFFGSLDTNILSIVVPLSVNQTTLNILYNYVWPKGYHILFGCCSTNSPRKLAEKVGKGICPECLAGLDDLPFEDVSWNPRWLPSEGLENPWDDDDDVSPLLQIPGHTARQHEIFRKDPFHIFKQTVGGHWVASAIVLLSDLGYWSSPGQSNQADVLLEVAYQDFHHFMKNEWQGHHVANIKNFTRALLHWPKIRTFPYGRFKGSDCMLMIRWLAKLIQKGVLMKETHQRQGVSLLDRPLEAWHKPFLQNILLGSTASVEFFPHFAHSRCLAFQGNITELGSTLLQLYQQLQWVGALVPWSGLEAFYFGALFALFPSLCGWCDCQTSGARFSYLVSEPGQLWDGWGFRWQDFTTKSCSPCLHYNATNVAAILNQGLVCSHRSGLGSEWLHQKKTKVD